MDYREKKTAEDYYKILSIGQNATDKEIKSAYRKLVLKYHPDRNPDNKAALESFREITRAYSVLINPVRRMEYDYYLLIKSQKYGYEERFYKHKIKDILKGILGNERVSRIFDEISNDGNVQVDEGLLQNILTVGLIIKVFWFGFWRVYPFNFIMMEKKFHPVYFLSQIESKFKSSLAKTVDHAKGFWDSIGEKIDFADKRYPIFDLVLTPKEAIKGATRIIIFEKKYKTRRFKIKIPSGLKETTKLRIRDLDGELYFLRIVIKP